MLNPKKVYLDTNCFVGVVYYSKFKAFRNDEEDHLKYCVKALTAAKEGDLIVYTSTITVAECQTVKGCYDDEVKRLFRSILTSGRIVRLVADSIFIAETARDLRWNHDINLKGVDAIHISSALEVRCDEFLTKDIKILKQADKFAKLGLVATKAPESRILRGEPSEEQPSLFEITDPISDPISRAISFLEEDF